MTFFHNLNKTLNSIAAKPEAAQLNERDMGKHNNATTGFKSVADKAAKEYGSKAAGERVAGAQFQKMKKAGKLEEEEGMSRAAKGYEKYGKEGMQALSKAGREGKDLDKVRDKYNKYDDKSVEEGLGDVAKKVGSMAKKAGSAVLNKLGHGDDVDMMRDLQKKMGLPQTGEKPMEPKEGNEFSGNRADAVKNHQDTFAVDGKEYPVKETEMTPKQKSFAALAEPKNKITFADKIAGAKQEVDEMLGDVAAEAMKGAIGKMSHQAKATMKHIPHASPALKKAAKDIKPGTAGYRDRADMLRAGGVKGAPGEVEEGWDDMEADVKRRAGQPKIGSITHGAKHDVEEIPGGRRVTRRVDPNTGHSVGADDDKPADGEKRGRGRPKGAPKGPERVTANATKHKGGRKMSKEEIDEAIAALEECGYSVTPLEEETTNKKDNRAEKAGKRVAKDIEHDEKNKDDIHGKKRGPEDDKAEKAGKKVAKDIEHDEKKDEVKQDEPKKSKSKFKFGGSVYEALDAQLETLITEGMSVSVNMSQDGMDSEGHKNISVNADGEDADKLAELLKMAGMQQHGDSCSSCGTSPCGCDMVDENSPNWPTDTETSDNAMQYAGGMNGPKSTGQATTPVLASQMRRQATMAESARVEQNLLNLYRTFGK